MSFMMTGYIIIALLVLVLVNIALRVSSKKKAAHAKQQEMNRLMDDDPAKNTIQEIIEHDSISFYNSYGSTQKAGSNCMQ